MHAEPVRSERIKDAHSPAQSMAPTSLRLRAPESQWPPVASRLRMLACWGSAWCPLCHRTVKLFEGRGRAPACVLGWSRLLLSGTRVTRARREQRHSEDPFKVTGCRGMSTVILFDHLFIFYSQAGLEAPEMKGRETAETKAHVLNSVTSSQRFLEP